MTKAKIPDPLRRRHLLEQQLGPEKFLAVAEAYLEEGRRDEALDFLARAEARDKLRALAKVAVREGDVFLLREASLRLGEEPDADTWRQLAKNADDAGKEHYAREARRLADSLG